MLLTLREDVHAAVIGDDVVLLDVAADAYMCLPGGAVRLRPRPDGRGFDPDLPDDVSLLTEAHLTAGDASQPLQQSPPTRPTRPLSPCTRSLTVREGWRLTLCLGDVLAFYWRRRFSDVLGVIEGRRSQLCLCADDGETARLAAIFQRNVVWLPIPGKCLVRSFVLLRFLQRSGCRADWVFGVKTWPFAAHCWVQLGDLCLDDHPDRLAIYEPIHVVPG